MAFLVGQGTVFLNCLGKLALLRAAKPDDPSVTGRPIRLDSLA